MTAESKDKEKFNWFKMFGEGVMGMSKQSRILWTIVIVKLIVMIAILRPIFFPRFLKSQAPDKAGQAEDVREQMIERSTISLDSLENNSQN